MNKEKTLEEIAQEKQRMYHREYYRKNRKSINARQQEWRAENPDKVKQYNRNYWLKRAVESQTQ